MSTHINIIKSAHNKQNIAIRSCDMVMSVAKKNPQIKADICNSYNTAEALALVSEYRTQLRMPCFQCPQPGEQSGRGYIAPLNPQSLSGGSTSISLISADTLVRVVTGQGYVSPSAPSHRGVQYSL